MGGTLNSALKEVSPSDRSYRVQLQWVVRWRARWRGSHNQVTLRWGLGENRGSQLAYPRIEATGHGYSGWYAEAMPWEDFQGAAIVGGTLKGSLEGEPSHLTYPWLKPSQGRSSVITG